MTKRISKRQHGDSSMEFEPTRQNTLAYDKLLHLMMKVGCLHHDGTLRIVGLTWSPWVLLPKDLLTTLSFWLCEYFIYTLFFIVYSLISNLT